MLSSILKIRTSLFILFHNLRCILIIKWLCFSLIPGNVNKEIGFMCSWDNYESKKNVRITPIKAEKLMLSGPLSESKLLTIQPCKVPTKLKIRSLVTELGASKIWITQSSHTKPTWKNLISNKNMSISFDILG